MKMRTALDTLLWRIARIWDQIVGEALHESVGVG